MTAIAHGVPVLVIAMSSLADQPLVGAAMQRAGVGAVLPRESSSEQIADAVSAILGDASNAERARELGAGWRHRGPVRAAADAIPHAGR